MGDLTERWERIEGEPLRDDFVALFANDIAYIKIADFVDAGERARVVEALLRRGLRPYEFDFDSANVPEASHLFEVHYLHEQRDPTEYFPRAAESRAEYRRLCAEVGFDPAQRVFDRIGKAMETPVEIARQGPNEYNHVIARDLAASSLLHADFGPMIPARWSISAVVAQYAWNLYLTDPVRGGECVLYHRFWQREDDEHLIPGSYSHDERLVADAQRVVIDVRPGDLMLFNCRNYHAVRPAAAPRITLGGHIGRTPDQRLIAWG